MYERTAGDRPAPPAVGGTMGDLIAAAADDDPGEAGEPAYYLRMIAECLWPGGDRDFEWSPDTIEGVAEVMRQAGYEPKRGQS